MDSELSDVLFKNFQVLLLNCRWRCTNAGGLLNRYMMAQFNYLRSGSKGKAFDVMPFLLPLSFFCRQTWFQLALLAGAVSLTVSGISAAYQFNQYSVANFSEYQLIARNWELIDSSNCIADSVNGLLFVLLWQGCEMSSSNLVSFAQTHCSALECVSYVSFREPQAMNGFTLKAGNLSTCVSSLNFRLQGYDAESRSWIDVGSSRFRRVRGRVRLLSGSVPLAGHDLVYDYRAPLPLVCNECWVPIISAICMAGISACGASGHRELVRHLVLGALALYSFLMAVVGAWFLAIDQAAEAFLPLALMASTTLLALLLLRAERQLALGLIAQGAWALSCRALSECTLHRDCAYFLDAQSFSYLSTLSLAFGVGVLLFIRRTVLQAVLAVRDDAAAYDEAWEPVIGNPARRRVLRELLTFTSQTARGLTGQGARHLQRRPPRFSASTQDMFRISAGGGGKGSLGSSGGLHRLVQSGSPQLDVSEEDLWRGVPGTRDEAAPVQCLGSLYSQAALAAGPLLDRAARWAAATNGAVEPPTPPAEMLTNLGLMDWIRLGVVKAPQRAVEKALLCYSGDVSRLLDICRVRIYLPRVQDLAACASIVAADTSAVIFNVLLDDPVSRHLGIENHVCEVQLVPAAFQGACLQDAERHGRYLKFRAVRLLAEEATLEGTGLLTRWDQRKGLLNNLLSRNVLPRHTAELGGPSFNSAFTESSAHRIARMGTVVPVDLTILSQDFVSGHDSSPVYGLRSSRPVSSLENDCNLGEDSNAYQGDSTAVRRPSIARAANLSNESTNDRGATSTQAVSSPVMDFDPLSICHEPDEETICPEGHFGGETGGVIDAAPAIEPDGAAAEDLAASPSVALDDELVYERKSCGQAAIPDEEIVLDKIRSDAGLRNVVHHICLRSVLQGGETLSSSCFYDSLLSSSSVLFTRLKLTMLRSRPVTVAATRPVFRFLAIAITIYYTYMAYSITAQLAGGSYFSPKPRAIRFTVLELRDPLAPLAYVNQFMFGLLLDNCALSMPATYYANVSTVANFQGAVLANGYYLKIVSGPPQYDPVRWKVEATDISVESLQAPAREWIMIGASMWRGAGAVTVFYPDIVFDMPMQRGEPLNFDSSPAWPWILNEVVTYYVYAVGWVFFILAGFSLHQRVAVWVMFGTYIIVALLEGVGAVGSQMLGLRRQAMEEWMYCIPDALLGLSILISERHIVLALKAYGVVKIIGIVVRKKILYLESDDMAKSVIYSAGFCWVVFTSACLVFRYWAHHQSRRLVLADEVKYDEAWATVLNNKNHRHRVASLKIRLQTLTSHLSPTHCRHYNRIRKAVLRRRSIAGYDSGRSLPNRDNPRTARSDAPSLVGTAPSDAPTAPLPAWESLLDIGVAGQLDFADPVSSLDQLYYQAIALNPILIKKIQGWAALSGGCFSTLAELIPPSKNDCEISRPFSSGSQLFSQTGCADMHGEEYLESLNIPENERAESSSISERLGRRSLDSILRTESTGKSLPAGYVRWNDVKDNETMRNSVVKWGNIKSVKRSIEKSTRSYGKDVSKLVDICRHSIYFETLSGVVDCLTAMANDSEVVLLRIKNRFDADYNAVLSGGYRNLAVNLRIVSDAALELGVETHVCEVQMLLLDMAVIKNDDGHKKYIRFRNLRGE